MEKQLTIQNIYHGRLDAKDEVIIDGIDSFVESFIIPNNLNINSVIHNTKCFVSGYKGTGKTALLYYLEDNFHKHNSNTVTVFIPFKEDYNEAKRRNMTNMAHRIVSHLKINSTAQSTDEDFEYIWSLEMFKHIIEANGKNNGGLFERSKAWSDFKQTIKKIEKDADIYRFVLKPSITYAQSSENMPSLTASIEPDEVLKKESFHRFIYLIDEAYAHFEQVTRTDIPFYIFIDELEAYYGDRKIFIRDLRLIRDLLIVSKRINLIFWKNRKFNAKIICAYRSEIMNAINRYTIPKEINKSIDGYDIPLKWDYSNTNSVEHPIMKILLRRIQVAEKSLKNTYSEIEVFKKWFPLQYHGDDSVAYILNFTWNKPRDIVRLLITAKDSIKCDKTEFSVDVFDSIIKPYSLKCLEEIQEEMRAVYSNNQVIEILQCFRGFRSRFTLQELEFHIKKNHSYNDVLINLESILHDLYRLGVIGNYSGLSGSYHWQHKGDTGLLFTDEWQMQIHRALWGALQISKKHDDSAKRIPKESISYEGKVLDVLVDEIEDDFARVRFNIDGNPQNGIIFKRDVSTQFVNNISDYIQSGYATEAKIIRYDKNHQNWVLTRNY